ncbi:Necrosis inducing protein [Phytophthora cactorum]|nr:Necrosis inducing protein [Phytophthora cactorum]
MNLRVFLLGAIASLAAVSADVVMIDHDTVQPFAHLTYDRYKPQLHISYGCHPYPAVQEDGSVSAGLKWSGWADGDCKGSGLGSQIYSRLRLVQGQWAIMYAWYFPKGRQYIRKYKSGHRHFWSLHEAPPPKSKFVIDGTTVKFDSYGSFWGSKQGVRLTKKSGNLQDLITWDNFRKRHELL